MFQQLFIDGRFYDPIYNEREWLNRPRRNRKSRREQRGLFRRG